MEEECYRCRDMAEPAYKYDDSTYSEKEIEEDHERCHGWFHCGNCCGPCVFCGQEGGRDDWEDEDAIEEGDE